MHSLMRQRSLIQPLFIELDSHKNGNSRLHLRGILAKHGQSHEDLLHYNAIWFISDSEIIYFCKNNL